MSQQGSLGKWMGKMRVFTRGCLHLFPVSYLDFQALAKWGRKQRPSKGILEIIAGFTLFERSKLLLLQVSYGKVPLRPGNQGPRVESGLAVTRLAPGPAVRSSARSPPPKNPGVCPTLFSPTHCCPWLSGRRAAVFGAAPGVRLSHPFGQLHRQPGPAAEDALQQVRRCGAPPLCPGDPGGAGERAAGERQILAIAASRRVLEAKKVCTRPRHSN